MDTYVETTIKRWDDIFRLERSFFSPFVFRGQQDSLWDLTSSIERIRAKYKLHTYYSNYTTDEKWMLFEFTRKYHLYSQHNLNYDDYFEWFAIMQHYGASTRLLDFTESIFIASYFAVIDSVTDSSIWAINRHTLRDNLLDDYKLPYVRRNSLKDEINTFHIDFANNHLLRAFSDDFEYPSTVIPLEPKLYSERLSRQQGMFLMPTNPDISFRKNLDKAFRKDFGTLMKISFEELIKVSNEDSFNTKLEIIKINIPVKLSHDIISNLKGMNITAEILFPGLEGLAKSLIQTQI